MANKALQLIFEYATAPATLKKVAVDYKDAVNKLAKKETALATASAEVDGLRKQVTELEKAFNAEINAWTPKGE